MNPPARPIEPDEHVAHAPTRPAQWRPGVSLWDLLLLWWATADPSEIGQRRACEEE